MNSARRKDFDNRQLSLLDSKDKKMKPLGIWKTRGFSLRYSNGGKADFAIL